MRSLLPTVGLLNLLLLLVLLLGSSCIECGRVIYFNQLNTTQAEEEAKNNTDALGKGMLLDMRGNRCQRGYVRDHHGRCRRRV
ncbi:uncharacterized protein LOC6525952 [Drosophila yakuba]|uniref:Uncharacterized protein n=1 Tax=Drosophila yakuba TaxID=7245 RepID=B4PXC9_DROYA|nr:uncharacterized protein LOC6525952 [Drosophila yakuba]EDX02880.1 uncharacterized protein Dyak_GE15430 [Drosophila yakuba]